MKTVLVLGITGGFGGHVAEVLAAQGWRIKAMLRDVTKLPEGFQSAQAIAGDAGRIEDVRRAAEGVEVIVYGINAPYPIWENTVLPWLDNAARVAEEQQLTIVFPGNVYNFNPADGPDFDERSPMRPPTPKGRLRQAMETRLKRASENGAQVIILRAGNFIGAPARSTWLTHLIKPVSDGYKISAAGPRDLKHAWAYLPDMARTIAELLARKAALPAFNVFHFKGYLASFTDIAAAIQQVTDRKVAMKSFPWWWLRLGAPFSPWIRSLFEMRYLWNSEVHLNDGKLAGLLNGALPHTPLADALLQAGLIERRQHQPEFRHG